MQETYQRLKEIIGKGTPERFEFITKEIKSLGLESKIYEITSSRGKDKHLTVSFNYNHQKELWLTANYDTYDIFPSGNNNGSGVVTLIGLSQRLRDVSLPINVRIVYFDAALDILLASKGKRNPDFIPGSKLFLQHMIEENIEFIDTYYGAITVQAVGKGDLCVFEKTGKNYINTNNLNHLIIKHAKELGINVSMGDNSPNADNISFIKEGLDATVLTRYHEGSWHKMQTKEDDINNLNVNIVDETIKFLFDFLQSIDLGERHND